MRRVMFALSLISCLNLAALTTVGATGGRLMSPAEIGQSPSSQRTVEFLKKEVRHELLMLPYYNVFDWLEAEIKDANTVILRGQVIRPTTKSEAENRVSRIEGVEKVINEIEVLPLSPSDDRLRRQIHRALFNWNSPLFHYGTAPVPSIHIIVKNGRVTLKGLVLNKGDSNYAYLKARGVFGSFAVTNELQIEASEKK